MSLFRRLLGGRGENAAAKYVRRLGWKVLKRNYICSAGEIDLICDDGGAIVFVEVRTRSTLESTDSHSIISPAKRRQLSAVAKFWIHNNRQLDRALRFDAIIVEFEDNYRLKCEHIKDAFLPTR